MKKTTNKGIKKLLLSVAAMAIALVGAATSTYAWFTMNATPAVGEFNVQVSTVQSLEIALDTRLDGNTSYEALNYKGFINGFEIENWIRSTATTGALKLIPAQTLDGYVFEDLYNGATVGGVRTASNYGSFINGATNERAFFEFTLYFRTTMEVSQIKLDMNYYAGGMTGQRTYVESDSTATPVSYSVPAQWLGDPAIALELNTKDFIVMGVGDEIKAVNVGKYKGLADAFISSQNKYYSSRSNVLNSIETDDQDVIARANPTALVANAMRMSFSQIKIDTDENLDARIENGSRFIWDPRAKEGNFLYNEDDVTTAGNEERNFAMDMMAAERDNLELPNNYFSTHKDDEAVANENVCGMKAPEGEGVYYYGAVTVRLWVDGWDAECFNGIMADAANIALQFRAA